MSDTTAAPIPAHVKQEQVFDFDIFFDPRLRENAHAGYESLHRDAPDVFYTPRNGGHWVVTRQADVRAVMQASDIFSSAIATVPVPPPEMRLPLPPQDMDGDEHRRHRGVLVPVFSRDSVMRLEASARELAVDLISTLQPQRGCDFIGGFAVPMPVKLFMGMMGMELERYKEFVGWVHSILSPTDRDLRMQAFMSLSQYLVGLIKERLAAPGDDVISRLVKSEIDGKPLAFERVLAMCNLLFLAGLDTVTNAMGFICRHLAENPDVQDELRRNPAKIPEAIEEFMRRYTFVSTGRVVTRDTEFAGMQMRAGDMVMSSLTAASLDDRVTPDPLTVDIGRPRPQHLGFNTGPHNCAGAPLARMEMRVFLEEWLARVPPFRLQDGVTPRYRLGVVFGLESLHLAW
ncbi:MAG: cytochrome [Hydrocarboniphaga sp.]|uniref:cytochrome P450 n=1 Tax=Hydrocarboniphaga sp. TaxID=2033016 RepID=UPI0026236CFC|nr:cytochrome P450 [Hydrocarboniphaga sp.]MDB5969898.1 cytochrome [Hydrocarboniphaga sp.]